MFAMQNLTAGQLNAIVKKLGGEEGAVRFLRDNCEIVWKSILSLVTTVALPAQPRFVAREKFVKDTSETATVKSETATVKIAWMGDDFQKFFLKKIEEAVAETTIAIRSLTKGLLHKEIRE